MGRLPLSLWATALAFSPVQFTSAAAQGISTPEMIHVVAIKSFQFTPAVLTVQAGDGITWKNSDFAPHTATSNASKWDSGRLDYDTSSDVISLQPGRYHYKCEYHPGMQAVIVVEPGIGPAPEQGKGT